MSVRTRPRLHSVAVELTERCNLRCAHCYNAQHDVSASAPQHAERSLARLRRLAEAFDLDNVTLTGGEPLEAPFFLAAIALLRDRDIPVQVISNGALLDERIADELARSEVRCVQVSLHGSDQPRHDAITRTPSFAQTIQGVEYLRSRCVPVVGCMVLTRENAGDVSPTLELWRSLGVTRIALSRYSPAGMASALAHRLLPSVTDLMEAFASASRFAKASGVSVSCTMPVPPCALETADFAPLQFGSCAIGSPKQEPALGADGRWRHCTLHRSRLSGDILEIPPEDAWAQALEQARAYRRETPAFCAGCVHAPSCIGGCGAASDWLLGEARQFPDPLIWQHVDDTLAGRLEALRREAREQAGGHR